MRSNLFYLGPCFMERQQAESNTTLSRHYLQIWAVYQSFLQKWLFDKVLLKKSFTRRIAVSAKLLVLNLGTWCRKSRSFHTEVSNFIVVYYLFGLFCNNWAQPLCSSSSIIQCVSKVGNTFNGRHPSWHNIQVQVRNSS